MSRVFVLCCSLSRLFPLPRFLALSPLLPPRLGLCACAFGARRTRFPGLSACAFSPLWPQPVASLWPPPRSLVCLSVRFGVGLLAVGVFPFPFPCGCFACRGRFVLSVVLLALFPPRLLSSRRFPCPFLCWLVPLVPLVFRGPAPLFPRRLLLLCPWFPVLVALCWLGVPPVWMRFSVVLFRPRGCFLLCPALLVVGVVLSLLARSPLSGRSVPLGGCWFPSLPGLVRLVCCRRFPLRGLFPVVARVLGLLWPLLWGPVFLALCFWARSLRRRGGRCLLLVAVGSPFSLSRVSFLSCSSASCRCPVTCWLFLFLSRF
jgi:hypothetical protein